MERYVMFVDYLPLGATEHDYDPPMLLEATTEKGASDEAIAKTNALYPRSAADFLIRIVGNGSGRTIVEIRRLISS